MDEEEAPLEVALETMDDEVGEGRLRLGALLDSFEDRPLGFVLVVFGLLVSLPVIGAIPGLPNVAALAILVASVHSWTGGGNRFWAPEAIRKRTVSANRVSGVLDRLRPAAEWVDGLVVNRRLAALADPRPARLAISLAAVVLAGLLVVLSIVPGLATVPGLGLVMLGLALMGRDGIFALAGYALAIGAAYAAYRVGAGLL